ncbi:MAG: MerR family transcriptional regulator [Deltaproteobacteria bacterium]
MATRPKGMRIAELSRRSGTTKETIHFYLREGLLRKPKKTSRNMAYYDETHVEQLKLIKRLRTESYLPLSVIKKVLKEGKLGQSARQLDLSGELFGQGARTQHEPITKKELAERLEIDEAAIADFEAAGLLKPTQDGKTKRYGYEDLRVAEIIRDAQREAGEGAESLVIERFQILERHMRALVRDEVSHFFSRVLTEGDPKRALVMLRGGRETLGRYLAVSRARRLRQEVDAILPSLEAESTTEPFLYPLPEARGVALEEHEAREALRAAFDARPTVLKRAVAVLSHLIGVGDSAAVIDLWAELSPKMRAAPEAREAYAEALILEERFDEAFEWIRKLREESSGPYVEALWGTIQLIRVRADFAKLEPSTELMGFLSQAFGAYDHARRELPDDGFLRARVLLLLGRVCLATPEFLGVHEQGRKDLRACLDVVRQLRRDADRDPKLQPLLRGPLSRVEFNAVHFLRVGTDDPDERRELEARDAELRS